MTKLEFINGICHDSFYLRLQETGFKLSKNPWQFLNPD